MVGTKYKHVLVVTGSLGSGGIGAHIHSYVSHLDKEKFKVDILVHNITNSYLENVIRDVGCKIYLIPKITDIGIYRYILSLKDILKNNGPYDVVHAHTQYQAGLVILAAKLSGVKTRITHSHSSYAVGKYQHIYLPLNKLLINLFATNRLACSNKAGYSLYGKSKFDILPNAIDIDKLTNINYKDIEVAKSNLGIDDGVFCIGHIGRFVKQKNHKFILDLVKDFPLDINYCVLFAGAGEMEEDIRMLAKSYGIDKNIKFLGIRNDINVLLHIFDLFLFPSLSEGLGIAAIESQAAGCYCIASTAVPLETDMGIGLIKYIDLDESKNVWIEEILKHKNKKKIDINIIKKALEDRGYSINSTVKVLERIYSI